MGGWVVRWWLQAPSKIIHRLIHNLHLCLHSWRGEKARDLRAVLLLGEAGVKLSKGIV